MTEPFLHLLRRKAVDLRLLPVGGAGKARVLMYHGIGEPGCHRVNIRHIGTDVFAHHLDLFRSSFHLVPLDRVFAGERHPEKLTVALTFDDGLRNNLTHALPLLEKYEVPASFFVTGANPCGLRILWGDLLDLAERVTDRELRIESVVFRKNNDGRYAETGVGQLLRDRIKQRGGFAPKQELYAQLNDLVDGPLKEFRAFWELLSDVEIAAVVSHPLITIGAHGFRHNDMGRIPLAEVRDELTAAREYLQQVTGRTIHSLAWPDGSFSQETIKIAAEMGLGQQLAVQHADGSEHDPRILDRYGVYDFPISDRFLVHSIAQGAA